MTSHAPLSGFMAFVGQKTRKSVISQSKTLCREFSHENHTKVQLVVKNVQERIKMAKSGMFLSEA